MSKDINDLRDRLFAALDGLADKQKPMEIERAKAIADVARVIVDSAKAEISLLSATGAKHVSTQFIPATVAGPVNGQRQLAAGGCSFCGGRMKPDSNGNGVVIDRCEDCRRSPAPTPKGEQRTLKVAKA